MVGAAERKIIHIDMDAFYAAIEQRDDPALRGKPIAVGGSSGRGVVMTASYEARRFGVRSAMPSVTAIRRCPELIFVKSRMEEYVKASRQIRGIFFDYTHLVEPLSLDEAYLDVTDNKMQEPYAVVLAEEIRSRIFEETGLTASAGVSYNKFLAKIASDINKPDGQTVIRPDQAQKFLEELPIRKFHGVGKVTAEKMHKLGVSKGAELKALSLETLIDNFGKVGKYYYKVVRGEDNRAVQPNRIRKSIGAERTFSEDKSSFEELSAELEQVLKRFIERVQKVNRHGLTLTLKVKTSDFEVHTRSRTDSSPFKDERKIRTSAQELLRSVCTEDRSFRLIGLQTSNFRDSVEQEATKQKHFEF